MRTSGIFIRLFGKFSAAILLLTIAFSGMRLASSGGVIYYSAPQEEKQIKAVELLDLFKSSDGWDKAYEYIGKIYAKYYNMGILPDRDMIVGLAEIVRVFLDSNASVLNQSAEDVVKEALKDALPRIHAQEIYWENIKRSAEKYNSSPSPENAAKLAFILPKKRVPAYAVYAFNKLLDYLYDQSDFLSTLEKYILEAEPTAVDVGFLLINLSDGAFAEDLVYIIGRLIEKDPRLFLQKLQEYHGLTEPDVFEILGSILNPVGWWESPDDPDELKNLLNTRINLRIKLLQGVEDENLRGVRDTCIRILKSQLIEDHTDPLRRWTLQRGRVHTLCFSPDGGIFF